MKKVLFLLVMLVVAAFYTNNLFGQRSVLENFSSLNSGVNNSLLCVAHSENNLFAAGDNLILISNDLGATWNQNYFDSLNYDSFRRIIANGQNVISLARNHIFRSGDDGNTWEKIIIPNYPIALHGANFAPNNHVYLTAALPAPLGYTYSGLYRSNDAGATWEMIENFEEIEVKDVVFINDSLGYVIGDFCAYGSTDYPKVVLITTTDGGLTWSEEIIEPLTMVYASKLMVDNETIHILGKDQNGSVFWARKADSGWQTLCLTWTLSADKDFSINNDKGYLVGSNGLILRMDSTQIWGQYYPTTISSPTNALLSGVDIAPDGIYIVGNNGTILKSDFATIVREKPSKNSFSVYPNPCPDQILTVNFPEKFSYRLFNLCGQEVSCGSLNFYQKIILPPNLSPGNYFLKIITQDDQKIYKKIVH